MKRYDCSLHQGWYCCRFMVMRMVDDKFGTGNALLVYADSVAKSTNMKINADPKTPAHAAVRLGEKDHDVVLASPQMRGRLCWVKYGAIWCPPCRLVDSVIDTIVNNKTFGDRVAFFEVDVDEQSKLSERWHNEGIPFHVFFYNGQQILVTSPRATGRVVDGGVCGGMLRDEIVSLATRLLKAAESGQTSVTLA